MLFKETRLDASLGHQPFNSLFLNLLLFNPHSLLTNFNFIFGSRWDKNKQNWPYHVLMKVNGMAVNTILCLQITRPSLGHIRPYRTNWDIWDKLGHMGQIGTHLKASIIICYNWLHHGFQKNISLDFKIFILFLRQ